MAELHLSRRAEELMEQGKTNVLGKALFKVFSSQVRSCVCRHARAQLTTSIVLSLLS